MKSKTIGWTAGLAVTAGAIAVGAAVAHRRGAWSFGLHDSGGVPITARVTTGALSRNLRAAGVLSLPEPGMHDVSLKVGGWIDRLYADQEGMHVQKGEPLLEVYSSELQVASQELIAAARAVRALDPA